MAWHPALVDTSAFVAQCPEEIHDLAREGCQYLLQLPASKTLSQSRKHCAIQDPCADNSSAPMWLLLPQQQRWNCYLGVFLDSWRQVVAPFWKRRLMTAAAPTLVNFRSISVDFIMWSLSIAILSEFGQSLSSCDHTFAHPFNEAVYLQIVFMCSWRRGWCL